ncbi:MAG: hypothetical protein IJ019_02665 [Alphaproteobacteria bacterium]|nr:hypothetical protein [Alphaproteobacteria bacterium]
MSKLKTMLQIVAIMQQESISVDEIKEGLKVWNKKNREFDLLCAIGGRPQRLRFECGKHFNPIGIFPFADSDFYVVFDRLDQETNRHNINNNRLPVMEDWKKICQVKELLNERLEELGKQELEGEYFAFTPVYLEETSDSWVVTMEKIFMH